MSVVQRSKHSVPVHSPLLPGLWLWHSVVCPWLGRAEVSLLSRADKSQPQGCGAGALRLVPPRGLPLWPQESPPADHSDGSSWKRGSRWRWGMHGTAPGSWRASESSPRLMLLPAHLEPQPHRGRWEAGSRLHLSGAPELRVELLKEGEKGRG